MDDRLMEFDGNKPRYITYYEHEAEIAREEEHVKRHEQHAKGWRCACLIVFACFVIEGIAFFIYEAQYEDVYTATQTITQDTGDGGGANTFTGDFYGGGSGKTKNSPVSNEAESASER